MFSTPRFSVTVEEGQPAQAPCMLRNTVSNFGSLVIARMYSGFMRSAFNSSIFSRLGYLFARNALGRVRTRLDPRRYNGAMLLGLNGIVIKSHGGTDAFGFSNAIGVAVDMIQGGFLTRIGEELHRIGDIGAPLQKAAVSG